MVIPTPKDNNFSVSLFKRHTKIFLCLSLHGVFDVDSEDALYKFSVVTHHSD